MSTEPFHVWYSETDADGKHHRKCEPFGKESDATEYASHLLTLDYIENILIEQLAGQYTAKVKMYVSTKRAERISFSGTI
jgi:hypothetical protein